MSVPFSMSIAQSLSQINFKIFILSAILHLVPTDFDHFFKFIVYLHLFRKKYRLILLVVHKKRNLRNLIIRFNLKLNR